MKSKISAPPKPRRLKDIVFLVTEAEVRLERTSREARVARGEFKQAKKKYRQARKAAKQARKEFEALTLRLKKRAARKPRARKLVTRPASAKGVASPEAGATVTV